MRKNITIECQSCGSCKAMLSYEPKYHGLRGYCTECGGNWPES